MRFTPYPYQQFAIDKIIESDKAGLFLDMGLGKTVITLTAIDDILFDQILDYKILVIAPLRVAEDTWSRESLKWDHLKHIRISKVLGTADQRWSALNKKADIYIINRENVVWLVDHYKTKWPFDFVIIDELSSFKASDSQRFRHLRKVRPFIRKIVGLTGTPAPNGLMDLWAQLYLLDRGERLGETIGGYRTRYFDAAAKQGHIVFKWAPRQGAQEAIHGKISDICISMAAKDYLDLPPRIDNEIQVTIPMDEYAKLEKEWILQLTETPIVADTAAVMTNKLLQIANGAVYDEDRGVHEIHDKKLDALGEIIDTATTPALVFYAYKHDRDRIMKRIKGVKELKTAKDIEDWNNGKISVLITHPASAGHGLNLQDGGNVIVWFGLTWSLELYQQANARLHRQGQQKTVIVHHLIATGTMDEDVMNALTRKDVRQSALLDAVRARVEKYKEQTKAI